MSPVILSPIKLMTYASLLMLGLSIVLAFIRLVRGPGLPDRVVALDLITTIAVGIIAVHAIDTDQPVLLRTGIVVALITFIGTVAFAYYVEKRGTS